MSFRSIFSSIICLGLLFIIIYPLKFVFFPYATTRVLLGLMGIPILLRKENLKCINNKKTNFFFVFFLIMLMSIFTLMINGTTDLFFFTYPFSVLIILSSCCLWHYVYKRLCGNITEMSVSKYIIGVVDIQMLIVIIFFLTPSLKEMALSLLTEELHPLSENGGPLSFRVSGFGSGYYASGIVHSFTLQICMYNICKKVDNKKVFYIMSFFLIALIGTIMSRTTLIGVVLALSYYFYFNSKQITHLFKQILKAIVISVAIIFALTNLNISISEEVDQQLQFGFELFYNYFESGEMETDSTNDLKDSYDIYPRNLKTWVVGDGKFFEENGDNYMETDNGYMRMMFYFGIIGMLLLFAFNFNMYKATSMAIRDKSLPCLFLLLYFIINLKGDVLHVAAFYAMYMFMPSIGLKREVIYNT